MKTIAPTKMRIVESAFNHIKDTIGLLPEEKGGILLGSREDYIVRKFVFDRNANTSGGSYDSDLAYLNTVVKKEWQDNKLALLGLVHSHPNSFPRLSGEMSSSTGDMTCIKQIFNAMPDLPLFLAPIIFSENKGKFKVMPYIVDREDPEAYIQGELEIIPDEIYACSSSNHENLNFTPDFSRLEGAISIDVMKKTHILCVGVGGANQICENLIRNGLGKLTVIDYDKVDSSNLTTQGFLISDVGKTKVDALENRIKNIDPNVEFNGLCMDFLEINNLKMEQIIDDVDLILMMTDNFDAQAKGNKVALEYNTPCVFAMMYEKARCSEISFNIPGITPSCHRCAVASRYKAYENGYINDVTSKGSTIFHTQYLNSTIGLLALAIIHRNKDGLELSNWFGDNWERNFIQLRSHPNHSMEEGRLFNRTLGKIESAFNFDSLWQHIEPEGTSENSEICPDCLSLGDLSLSSKVIALMKEPCFRKSEWFSNSEL